MDQTLSQLLGLPQPTVTAVLEKLGSDDSNAQQFLASVQEKLEQSVSYTDADETLKEKARLQYENTRLENELHRLNTNIGQVKSQLEGAKSKATSHAAELKELQASTSKLQGLLDGERNQRTALETQLTQQQQQLAALQDEKREHLSQISERREELDDRRREISRMTEIIQDLRAQASQDHEQLARLRAQTSVADVNEHMLKQSLELAKNQVKWLDEELVKTQTEMQHAKTELSRSSTIGRAETARLRAEIESLNEQIDESRSRSAQTDRTLRAKMEAERLAKEELAERTEQFKSEMTAQKKLCAEWERTTEAAKEHVRGVEASLRELENHQKTSEDEANNAVTSMEQQLEQVEQAYNAAHERAEKLEDELRNANRLLTEATASSSSVQGKLLLSPTATVASQVQSTQKSLNITQLYSEKVALEDRLKSADSEVACLRQSMEQILSEIEERGPIIAAEREEYHRLLEDADRIAKDLAEARQDSGAKDRSLKETLRERELLQRQVAMEKQQTRDLERQVAGLLRAAEEARTGSRSVPDRPDSSRSTIGAADLHSSPDEEEKWLNDVDQVISQKLVAFSDINELVAQNRRLLRTTRELAAQVAQEEELQREANEDQVKDALEQAEALLDQLSTEFDDAKRRLGVVERERDMLKTIKGHSGDDDNDDAALTPVISSLEQHSSMFGSSISRQLTDRTMKSTAEARRGGGGGGGSASAEGSQTLQLAQLQDDFDTYKSETRKTRTQLERDATKLQAELSEFRVRAAKAESQNQFDSDRIQMFTRDLEARQKEIDHLRLATSRLHSQAESYEKQLDTTTQSMTADRVELSKLRRQTAVLEAERDNLAANEKRWRSEEQRLITERASLTQILENTTKMRDEWQRASEQQVAQVRERLEAARKETDDVRVELRQAREANERAQFKNDADLRELRGQIEQRETRVSQMQDQIVESKEAHAKILGEKREVEVSRDALQRQVAVLEVRIQSQESLVQRAKGQGQEVSKESLLTVQLQDSRSQIESLQSELATTSKRAEDYRQLSSTNESSLDELTRTYDQYKAEQERVASEQKARVERLEASLHEAQASLASCQSELETARQAAQTAETTLEAHKTEIASRLAQLEDAVEQKTQSLASLRDDMRRHEESAQGLQEQYEREIVAHAKDIEGTLLAREKLRETQRKLAETTDELQACEAANARLKQDDRKARDKADQDVKVAEDQLSEIRRQNSLLLAHLESLGHQVPDVSVDPEQLASAKGDAADDDEESEQPSSVPSSSSGLRDVVVYLRRERDLVTAQLELAQQESQRWKQQSTHTQRMLDEARNELMQYTPAVTGNGGTTDTDGDATMGQQQSFSSSVEAILAAGEGPLSLTASQRQSCRQLIEQATLLRESNTVLRTELNGARARLHSLETELAKVKDQEVPQLRSTNASLQAELDAARAEVQQLQHMCEHWKQRHEKIIAKYQMIEPEEYEALKQQNQELRATAERMTAENAHLQELNRAAATQKATADSQKTKLLQSEIIRLKSQIDSLMNDLSNERGKLAGQEAQADELLRVTGDAQEQRAKFTKLHATFQTLRKQSMGMLEESKATIRDHETTIQALNQQIGALRGQIEAGAEQQGPDVHDETVAKLQSEIAMLAKDKDDATTTQQQLAYELQKAQQQLEGARAELASAQNVSGESAGADASSEVEQLRQKLVDADTKVKSYEAQLQEVNVRANKYVRDNKVLQSNATQLKKQLADLQQTQQGDGASSSMVEDLQRQLSEAQKQLAESEARIESAKVNAKKSAELRSKLQISRADKRAADLDKQVNELQEKIVTLESSAGGAIPLKRPLDSEDTPAKKPHVDKNDTAL